MTKKDKELLFKELCARLPYKIKVKVSEVSYPVEFDVQMLAEIKNNNWYEYPIPYLRPMSSMTEEERRTYDNLACDFDGISMAASIDWLNENMFDYRGLIPMGLALEAPEDMYK